MTAHAVDSRCYVLSLGREGVITNVVRTGWLRPRYRLVVKLDDEREVSVCEDQVIIPEPVVRIPFRPRVVGGTDYQDTLPCEVEG